MDSITPNPVKSPPPLAWVLVWLSQSLIIGCLYAIPTVALHRPSRTVHPLPAPNWHLPVLLAALYASVMTWQSWYTRKNDRGRFKPKKPLDPAARKKQRWVLGLILGGPLLLFECVFVFGVSGGHADWPLLLALNMGMAAGWGLLLWANRLMPVPPGPGADPLAPEVAPAAAQTPPPAEPVREVAYADRNRTGLPPLLAWGMTFVSASAMAGALIAGALGRFWDASLGIPMSLLMALAVTAADRVGRKRTGPNKKVAENTTGFLVSFLAIGIMLRILDFNPHGDWLRLLALDAAALAAYGVVRWSLTLSVATQPSRTTSANVEWLTTSGSARWTGAELVMQKPWVLRAFIGGFSLVMWGVTGAAAVVALDPGVFPGPQPHGAFWRILPGICALVLACFAFMFTSGSGPQELRLDLVTRTYTLILWKPLPEAWGPSTGIPFNLLSLTGTMDADMAGVGLREYRLNGSPGYALQLVWADRARPAQVLHGFTEAEEARAAMLAASEALGLPALGRCD